MTTILREASHDGEVVTTQAAAAIAPELTAPLRVEWHDSWSAAVDEAFAALPYDPLMDPELVRALWDDGVGRDRQKVAVLRAGGPSTPAVGVVPLRRRGKMSWQILTQYVMPYARFHVAPEHTDGALALLGSRIDCDNVLFHRLPARTRMLRPEESWVATLEPTYEALLQRTKYGKNDRKCRRYAAGLELREDEYDALPEALMHWRAKWEAAGSHATARRAGDLLLGFQVLARQGRLKTFSLYDGDNFAAMGVNLIGPNTLYFLLTVTRDEYKKEYAGIRNLLAAMEWGCAHGLAEYDMLRTSGHYKHFWAEPEVRGFRLVRSPLGSEALGCGIEAAKDLLRTLRDKG